MSNHNLENNKADENDATFSLENIIEKFIFNSRWILSIFYLFLVLTLVLVAIKFLHEFQHFALNFWADSEAKFLTGVLSLVDKTLLANLLLLVIFSGYENFVSVIGVARRSSDRPKWMGGVDFASLKLKLIGSIVALSGINLLAAFLEIETADKVDLAWQIGLHVVFLFTGVLFALSERIAAHAEGNH
ncbi:COG2862 Predicted membrane protein [Burkholderiaceae bacterium]|jgi:uncharacterized protein (TIGR00645 family)